MQEFLKQLTTILKQNNVFHAAETFNLNGTDRPSVINTYTVYHFEEKQQPNDAEKSDAPDNDATKDITLEATPVVQIKHTPKLSNLDIFINQTQVYNFNNFVYNAPSVGFEKAKKSDTQKKLDNIMDICIKKSNQIHIQQLKHIKQMLKASKIK